MPNLGQNIYKSKLNGQDIYDKFDIFGNPLNTMSLEDLDQINAGNSITITKEASVPQVSDGFLRKNSTQINAGLNLAKNLTGVIGRGQSTFNGPKGDIRAGIEEGWDSISDTVANFGPYGQMASMAMKATGVLNNIQGAIFGATDGMTTKDAIFDSPLGFLTGVGWLNQAGGKKSHTITKDDESFETVGASYGGTGSLVDDALTKSGKKYGLFSRSERKQANSEIAEATRQQNIMTNIANNATDRFAIRNSMSAINGNSRAFAMQGGYDQSAIRVGREGMIIAKRVVSKHKTTKRKQEIQKTDPFEIYLQSLPENQRDTVNYRARDYWEFNGRPKNFGEAIAKGMFTFKDDGFWHANSVQENPNTGEIEFMKSDTHPTHQLEVNWYNSNDGAQFRQEYELVKSSPYWKYIRRETPQEFKEGGAINNSSILLEVDIDSLPEEFKDGGVLGSSIIQEVEIEEMVEEFKEGGAFNIIPEGALHARLHHMENSENLTQKGIPVVSEKEGGELEQHAEIEKEEIILRLSLTKKLEELAKEDTDESALEAGKILVEEILNNTIDNTNNLL